MADHEFSSMDFEEGEVDDNSESDDEASPLDASDKRRYAYECNPIGFSSDTRSHSQRDKHQIKHKHDKKSQVKSRHKQSVPTKSNGHGGHENRMEKEFSRSRRKSRRPSLKEYVSENEVDFHVSEREKLVSVDVVTSVSSRPNIVTWMIDGKEKNTGWKNPPLELQLLSVVISWRADVTRFEFTL